MGLRYDNDANIPVNAFSNALNILSGKGASMIAISGDIGSDGVEAEYITYSDILKTFKNSHGISVYSCMGNHDCYNDGTALFKKYVSDYSDNSRTYVNDTDFYVKKGSDIFYFLSQRYSDYNTPESRLLDNSQLDSLESVLEQHSGGKFFLFFHTFIGGESGDATNGVYKYPLAYTEGTPDCERFKKILRENKDIIFFSGHSHWEFDMQNCYNYTDGDYSNSFANISDGGGEYCTLVHIPSCTSPRTIEGMNDDRTELFSVKSEGYFCLVYDSCVVIYGVDLISGYILPLYSYVVFS